MRKTTILSLLCLSACGAVANTESNFLCGAETGQPCASLSEVDGSVQNGVTVKEHPVDTANSELSESPLLTGGKGGRLSALPDGGNAYGSSRYRIPEKVGALWVPPRLDDNRVLHEAHFVHFVLRDATWGNR